MRLRSILSPRRLASSVNASVASYKEKVWLLGDARSGTTWVSDLINANGVYREVFEPFHPKLESEARRFSPHFYVGDLDQAPEILDLAERVFRGKFWSPRSQGENGIRLYRGLLVKDVFANLIARAVCARVAGIRPILLIRNPFAVALSKQNKPGWYWLEDPTYLLRQQTLVDDFLGPNEDLIRRTADKKDFILNQICIWCVINLIPLKQFAPSELHICLYEKFCADPLAELTSVMNFVHGGSERIYRVSTELVSRPSRMSGTTSTLISGRSPLTAWQEELSSAVIDQGMELMAQFELGDLYANPSAPDLDAINHMRSGTW